MSNKRSVTIARHRTSISLEDEFWMALAESDTIASVWPDDQRRMWVSASSRSSTTPAAMSSE